MSTQTDDLEARAREWWNRNAEDVDDHNMHPAHWLAAFARSMTQPKERAELKRFNPVHLDAMVSEPDGTHVLYSEIEPLEAEVSRLKDEAEEMRKAFRFIKEIGEREPMTANDQTHAIYKMVKWANYGLATEAPTSEGSTTKTPTEP